MEEIVSLSDKTTDSGYHASNIMSFWLLVLVKELLWL